MAKLIDLQPSKTYATRENAQKAFEAKFPSGESQAEVRYIIATTPEGRFFPVGLGERAVWAMVHHHFCVAM